MIFCEYIFTLFNRWADEGEKNIHALMPKPLDVDFTNYEQKI